MCAPCLFGLEGLVGNELRHLKLNNVNPETGRVRFTGDEAGLARANICSRFAERILIEIGEFRAESFEELFEGTYDLPWEAYIPPDGQFPVKGFSLDSQLHSIPDCQKIIKKAIAVSLGGRGSHLPENGALYQVQFAIRKDVVTLYLDTSGVGLHKRGYRPAQVAAPLRETLAAAMVDLARYRGRGEFRDPFCGSGTIAIEAALAARNRAPGLLRKFAAEEWNRPGHEIWTEERKAAREREFHGEYHIEGTDIDPKAIEIAKANSVRAGVADITKFRIADARSFSENTERGVIVTNPPYGERLLDRKKAEELCGELGKAYAAVTGWSLYLLSSNPEIERIINKKADKKRRLYNGTIPCELYMFTGYAKNK